MILQGDCLQVLSTMDEKIIQTCVTSPPFYGLRDYGTASWEGGSVECDHTYQKGGRNPETSAKQISSAGTTFSQYERVCKRCGAIRIDSQIGLEDTPEAYVEKLVAVFREVWRVLKDDGTLWLNLGDSYAGSGKGRNTDGSHQEGGKQGTNRGTIEGKLSKTCADGLKPKDLIGIPWMVAFALRADGWYLRSDIIWNKPNPMPESVTDRPTKSHEYIFLMSKSATYYYDAEAVRESNSENSHGSPKVNPGIKADAGGFTTNGKGKTTLGQWTTEIANGRNRRTVWTVTSKPYKGAHFATFPPDLIEPCILAGSRVGDIVLDPFNGSGTTGSVAIKHHRDYIGIELKPAYIELSNKRLSQTQPVLMGIR